ncbi:hypothetical protein BURK1_00529 [Burkholderiales bacterium]|nr:hypothetical protein BURK1_00529 [Burkholderiales bacterium]
MTDAAKPWSKLVYYGLGSAACYVALFANEQAVMATFTRTDGVYWLLPVATAFVISYFHGGFTGCFWEVLGVQAKRPVPKDVTEAEVEE